MKNVVPSADSLCMHSDGWAAVMLPWVWRQGQDRHGHGGRVVLSKNEVGSGVTLRKELVSDNLTAAVLD